jgi:hypothetical protein
VPLNMLLKVSERADVTLLNKINVRFETSHNGTHSSHPNGIVCYPGITNLLVAIHIPFQGHSICLLQTSSPHQLVYKQGKPSSHKPAVPHLFVTNTTKVKLTQSIATRSLESTHTEHVCWKLHHSA